MRPFFLLLLLHLRCIAAKSAHVSPENRALMSIKAAITKDPDSALASWDQNTDFCKWRGVTCKPHLVRVTAFDISNLDLGGTLSPQIGRLQFLESLSVAGNFLSGPIPAEIGGLRHLRYLNLSGNQFNLSFPDELYGLPNLRVLDVYNNNMTGQFLTPANLVTKLRHLNVGGNYFTGKIPPELGSFSHLEYLAVSGNSLTGAIPPEIGNLKKLKELYIGYYNSFSGGIPKEIGNLSNLVVFDAGNCDLSGAIPPAIGNLNKLELLYLPQNRLSSGFPPELGKLTNLYEVDLTQNMLTGTIPSSFAQLKNLRLFSLFLNKLSGSIPDFIAEFPKLEVLLLWGNNFSGIIPQKLGTNQSLSSVDVSSNNLIGNLPPNLCNGNRLSALIVKNNLLSGPVPESLGLCTSLRRLLMNNNILTGHIPIGLFSLPNLNMVDLQSNHLSGPFPTTDKSVSLGMIILSNNSLSGALPPSIGNFVSVNKLLLDGNMFSGRIPAEISKLHMLSTMNFSNNRFSNSIPPEISLCRSLIYLDLSQNQLSGEIPNAISDLHVLHYLNLSRNHLTGTIPVSIASMLSLTSTDFSYNNLSGSVPNIGQFNNFHNESFAGNPGLCGPLLNPCGESVGSEAKSQDKTSSVSLALIILQCIVWPVCLIAIAMVVYAKYKFLSKSSSITEDHDHTWKLTAFQPLDFKCCDVVNCLKEENIIGKGGAGIVYKGDMPNGQEVAVKRLPAIRPGSENDRGFKAEIETLGPIRHRYIVQLLGYSTNKQTNLLIYEHMPNGSLGEVLHGNRGGLLHWETRYKIAVQAAKGLCYLHNDCKPLIIHRDVKSNNILLDANFDAHLADFGLAKFLLNTGGREYVSAVAGSYGYIAPEYAYSLQVDDKSDVYSFGVVLLELITGKRPIGGFGEGIDIVEWARNTMGEEMEGVVKILDPRLPATTPLHEVQKMFRIAMHCVEEQPTWRPCIRKVIQMLTEPLPPPPPYSEPMGFSSLF